MGTRVLISGNWYEWDKLVSELDHIDGGESTLSVERWFGDGKQPSNLHEKIMRIEVELIEFSRTLEKIQRKIGDFDAGEFASRLDETNSRLRSINNAIAIQGRPSDISC